MKLRKSQLIFATVALGLLLCACVAEYRVTLAQAKDLKDELGDTTVSDLWVYDDLEQGLAYAKETGKAVFLVFR